jgi:hypothetical protein
MASIIVIQNGSTGFNSEAAEFLAGHGFREVSDNTFIGNEPAEPLVDRIKALESYAVARETGSVQLHHGFVSKA